MADIGADAAHPAARSRRRPWHQFAVALVLLAAVLGSLSALDWDLSVLSDPRERAQVLVRLASLVAALRAPDFSPEFLRLAGSLALDTLAIAALGTALGVALGWLLGLCATRALVLGSEPPPRGAEARVFGYAPRRLLLELARLVLDALRGIPDFAWAILILSFPGPGPVTGVLAIALNVAGILGKIYSELWDAVEPRSYAAQTAGGARRMALFFYGIQPRTARAMLSFTLMRAECAVRNASVIGALGGGGLGGQMYEEFGYRNYSGALTLLLAMLALTAGADLLSNFLRRQLRADPNHPRAARDQSLQAAQRRRRRAFAAVGLGLALAALHIGPAWGRARAELGRIEWDFLRSDFGQFLRPDLAFETLGTALSSMRVPLALGLLGTALGVFGAALLAYPASVAFQLEPGRFTGENPSRLRRARRAAGLLAARGTALASRAIPEVAWVFLFAACFRAGVLAGVLALGVHSMGVLARVYTESIDNVAYRRLEPANLGSRSAAFLYAGLPGAAREWLTYAFFQFEANVRTGVLLGILGLGGLGDLFHTSFALYDWRRASTFLLGMIALTVAIDRCSRALAISRLTER